jgi:MSHA pilin protein MshA
MKNNGFTLIEMIITILLLSILAVTALPRFVNLTDEAKAAVVAGLASEITTQGKINFLGYQLSGQFSFGSSAPATSSKVISTSTAAGPSTGACATLLAGVSGFSNITVSGTANASVSGGAFAVGLPGGLSIANDTVCAVGGVSIGATATCTIFNINSPYISATAGVMCTN